MKHRKLRIAWSVACGILCLLLIVLWVRSYSGIDATQGLRIASSQGTLYINQSLTLLTPTDYNGPVFSYPHFGSSYTFTPSSARVQFIRPGFGLPYWAIVLTMTLTGVAPWFGSRFSLRTLLIGMTVVAVALGLIFALSR
jgi:hypothetical protein